ncbi:acyl carrier protein [Ferruginibacter paludis]|uniref:acyl carrier protein n=1 Tax=Ferruginibacter paludis TaxID=1310417 RepID=UPI0025B53E18|nr:acyl carrier protein [Ferruginibacter paludis]MDN3658884.1 acyl carrier protein [Ferruginibacter paludis]
MKEKFFKSFKEALQIENREILQEDVFRNYEEWNSLGRLCLIVMLDEEYDLQIEDKEFEKLISVGDLFKVVERKMNH